MEYPQRLRSFDAGVRTGENTPRGDLASRREQSPGTSENRDVLGFHRHPTDETQIRRTEMMNTIARELRDAPLGQDDYVGYLHDVVDGVVELDDADAVFAEAFSFFERNSDADLGMPGPLVHFLEQFYPAYVDQLCTSVERKPTTYTVWMLNRILNSSLESLETMDRKRLLAALDAVSKNSSADSIAREQASEFLRQQLG